MRHCAGKNPVCGPAGRSPIPPLTGLGVEQRRRSRPTRYRYDKRLASRGHVQGWGDSESSRRFTDVDQYVSVEGGVGDVYQPVLQTVETVELKPSRPRVQQLRPANRRRDTIVSDNRSV